jgi:hypothetical protein
MAVWFSPLLGLELRGLHGKGHLTGAVTVEKKWSVEAKRLAQTNPAGREPGSEFPDLELHCLPSCAGAPNGSQSPMISLKW